MDIFLGVNCSCTVTNTVSTDITRAPVSCSVYSTKYRQKPFTEPLFHFPTPFQYSQVLIHFNVALWNIFVTITLLPNLSLWLYCPICYQIPGFKALHYAGSKAKYVFINLVLTLFWTTQWVLKAQRFYEFPKKSVTVTPHFGSI